MLALFTFRRVDCYNDDNNNNNPIYVVPFVELQAESGGIKTRVRALP